MQCLVNLANFSLVVSGDQYFDMEIEESWLRMPNC